MPENFEARTERAPDADKAAVIAADDARLAAMCGNDLHALGQLLDDGLSYCHSTGAVEDKSQYLDALRSGRVKYVSMQRDIAHLGRWGACAVMQGTVGVTAEVAGQPYRTRAAFTATWVETHGAWRMAAWQATPSTHA
ncbi:nuclear transport factor 2 family protein [Variovorax sp. KK3]|uniref:nuclear transport factor 2 family protein n=1 Tax=Variovorax sp. KK3 TaxID=1855728 RepID=UPI00097C785C|nr:nuclear transport factor 2 family protein [Variovorax sp. KK3]